MVILGGVGVLLAAARALTVRPATLPTTGAVLVVAVLAGAMVGVRGRLPSGMACPTTPVVRYLAGLPQDAIVAGDPRDLMCVPATAKRAVVISTQLAPSYEADYFRTGRARMFAMLRAYYGPSRTAIADLASRYGATHLWVRRDAVRREVERGARWKADELPYGRFVRDLVESAQPAVLGLPPACRRFVRGPIEVYEIACLGRPL
jgi:hypothetical protein